MKRLLACSIFGFIATACAGNPTAPDDVLGVYDLRRLNNARLPYDHEVLGCCTYLSGNLEIKTEQYSISLTARNRNTSAVFTAAEWGSFESRSREIVFVRDSFAVAPFLLDTGVVRTDTIEVRFGGEGPGSPDQFNALFVLP